MNNHPFISIVIPVRNEEALIRQCLENLKELNYPKFQLEIIIADGLSTDNTAKTARSLGAKVVVNHGQTVGPGRNVGFKNSQGDLVAFSDADCVVDKDWLANSLKYFKDEKVGGIGGPSLAPEKEGRFGRAVRLLFLIGSWLSDSVYVTCSQKIKSVKSVPGCNAIYRREALEKIMPVDEGLLTCDDVEMNYQLKSRGYEILYVPDVKVWHYRRDNPKKFWKQAYRYAIGRLQLAKRHQDAISLVHIIAGLFIPIFVSLLIFSFILNPVYPAILIGLTLMAMAASNIFLALVVFIFAWSAGFLRELVNPFPSAGRSR